MFSRLTKEKKAKMPREESQLLTRNWLLRSPRPSEQRPVSVRFDADLLADQQIPPAPVLKDPSPGPPSPPSHLPPSPPPKNAAREHRHMCVRDGHVFRIIDLRKLPGAVPLDVTNFRSYPTKLTAHREHHGGPPSCDKCDRCDMNVYNEIHECEIPVCRTAVCLSCAVEMENERQKRALKSWDHTSWAYRSQAEQED